MKKKITNNLLVSYTARKKYRFPGEKFQGNSRIYFENLFDIRKFADSVNAKRNVLEFPERALNTGDLYGMSLIQDIFQYVVSKYEEENPHSFEQYLTHLNSHSSKEIQEETFTLFVTEFPESEIFDRSVSPRSCVRNKMKKNSDIIKLVKEIGNLRLYNTNPAFSDYSELFDDKKLLQQGYYREMVENLKEFFRTQPAFGPQNQNLLEMLETPAKEVPYSIKGQLEWIRNNWGDILDDYLYKILISLDLISEEQKARGGGPGPVQVHVFDHIDQDYEKFSEDQDWMPKVVVLAKNTHVWLSQLSEKYNCSIRYLSDIPNEELDILQKYGITSLWLIGLWERSVASKRIKQMMGNKEAVASAYSLLDYSIAAELGGEEAYENLRKRARQRGIRLCGDMVPNHVGIDSKWVINHPDWFISSDYSPFPSYQFSGKNLCNDERVGIYLEDHYFEKSDAAVVFKRVDHYTGDEKYIYHGNDGTSMPWNDTAQLNYMKAEVREAVIQTILHVARNFDIIRFDAAMTLAKKHYQRLWFPQPGTGGDIPSRAEHAMTREEFDRFFPQEFWREVVDRVTKEEPDTLLLAEAFWMMESYFVRTLGMHRVYNSAFMHMLKNEDNEKYRQTIKNVLEFNPEILKRYVNFMNNPDEETARVQFGDGDKYFGICLLMSTLPGLPMFGHGQIEGYREKYGMEFKKAYWKEEPDSRLIQRHEKQIFPLLHKRYLFSEVKNFYFYDYISGDGEVNNNVFAFSNRAGEEKALIIYNNSYSRASGWISESVLARNSDGELVSMTLGKALQLQFSERHFAIFRDQISGLEYIRSSKSVHESGLFTILEGFQYHGFVDFREVEDFDGLYSEVNAFLNGRGVPGIELAIQQILVKDVHVAMRKNYNEQLCEDFFDIEKLSENLDLYRENYKDFLRAIKDYTGTKKSIAPAEAEFNKTLNNFIFLMKNKAKNKELTEIRQKFENLFKNPVNQVVFYSWVMLHSTGKIFSKTDWEENSRSLIKEMFFNKLIDEIAVKMELKEKNFINDLVLILTEHQNWFHKLQQSDKSLKELIKSYLSDFNVRSFIRVNRYNGVLWFQKESLEMIMDWMEILACLDILKSNYPSLETIESDIEELYEILGAVDIAVENSNFQLEKFLQFLK